MTTIRVEADVRDRLAARAKAHGRSLGAEHRRLATHRPAEMADYQVEAAEWTSASLGDLAASAADEYPEYNS